MYNYNYLVFICRCQPPHLGHLHIFKRALQEAKHLIILVGSCDQARNPRNPFTFQERQDMIRLTIEDVLEYAQNRIHILPINDYLYDKNDNEWIAQVQRTVNNFILKNENTNPHNTIHGLNEFKVGVGLIGHAKDHTSYYLKMFPEWDSIDVTDSKELNATDIRDAYFCNPNCNYRFMEKHLTPSVQRYLNDYMKTDTYKWLQDWYKYDESYKKSWKYSPFPVVITCVDAVVTQSGHILLVERAKHPGKELLALPGGHVNENETFRNAVIRELREETHIADSKGELPPAMLDSFIDDTKTTLFDYPHRSSRGRVITQAYHFDLPKNRKLFKVRGDDDAATAHWYKFGDLKTNMFFEDHAAIIRKMTGNVLGNSI